MTRFPKPGREYLLNIEFADAAGRVVSRNQIALQGAKEIVAANDAPAVPTIEEDADMPRFRA